ncbi:MAG: flagellar hook-associated protein FlgK [Alphaproteobacteria bacterium]|nr:flagellar hook-associated protein FlgK [Alphaproteobacteria bacterium]
MALLNSISSSLSGMKVAQAQLEIVSNNIANVDTIGYTRKTASQAAVVVAGQTMGVTMENARRNVDEGLLKNYLSSNALSSSLSSQYNYLTRMDNLMGRTADGNSLAANVGNLQSALETFSTTVSSAASRYSLLTAASELTAKLNYTAANIQTLRGDADREISDAVSNINSLLHSIDSLNVDIVKYTVLNRDGVANLKDQRDNALRELSGYLDITYYTRDTGAAVIQTTSGITLLDTQVYELSHTALAQVGSDNSYDSGNIQGIFVDGKDITASISGGSIGGLIDIRDNQLPSFQSQLDELAQNLYSALNAVHNQGTSYPNMPYKMTGTVSFIADNSSNPPLYTQQLRINQGSDVRLVIFDEEGNQTATATMLGSIGFSASGETLSSMMTKIQNWLRGDAGLSYASVSMDDNHHLVIDTGDSSRTISIIDEASSTAGSAQTPASLSFDVNGDGTFDASYSGFSDFFGLNDFFVDNINDYILDSKVVNARAAVGVNSLTRWSFSDSVNGFNYGDIDISRTMTIQDIAAQINDNAALNTHIKASLIKNGDGYMLRVESLEGAQLEIAETLGGGILEKLDMAPSSCGYAATIAVRSDILENANLIVCGSPQFNSDKGAYAINAASNNIANRLADAFASNHTFKQSGNMAKTTTTIANYASTFVGNVSSSANTAESSYEYQSALTSAISDKEAQFSGIDLDEELAQMIIYQQSYAACAQVFTASREILDVLINMV